MKTCSRYLERHLIFNTPEFNLQLLRQISRAIRVETRHDKVRPNQQRRQKRKIKLLGKLYLWVESKVGTPQLVLHGVSGDGLDYRVKRAAEVQTATSLKKKKEQKRQ
uniref:Small subunit ribosomal protein S24 n=1 Tax=Heterorhabditis bacteriophora TaxID=37862 RepID=A0A1I7XAC1_HETBA